MSNKEYTLLEDPFQLRSFIKKFDYHHEGWRTTKNRIKKVLSDNGYQIFDCLDRLHTRSWNRAEKYGFSFNMRVIDLWEIWHRQNGRCAMTGIPLSIENGDVRYKNPWKVSIDRVNSDLGYEDGNVRLVTHWYNNAKNTWDDETCLTALKQWKLKESL